MKNICNAHPPHTHPHKHTDKHTQTQLAALERAKSKEKKAANETDTVITKRKKQKKGKKKDTNKLLSAMLERYILRRLNKQTKPREQRLKKHLVFAKLLILIEQQTRRRTIQCRDIHTYRYTNTKHVTKTKKKQCA
uniref:Uncharacterized protein n=1 Tax=Anopheles minimus TaxID=112268 RepID=A0A182WHS8_9DIPT